MSVWLTQKDTDMFSNIILIASVRVLSEGASIPFKSVDFEKQIAHQNMGGALPNQLKFCIALRLTSPEQEGTLASDYLGLNCNSSLIA